MAATRTPSTTYFPDLINEALAIAPINANGRRFDDTGQCSTEQYRKLAIAKYKKNGDLKHLAACADVITTAFTDWSGNNMVSTADDLVKRQNELNTTSFANMAHVAMYATSSDVRQHAAALLKRFCAQN